MRGRQQRASLPVFLSKAYMEEAHRRGIVIDRLWVGHSKIWRIKGMEGVPYVKP